ncbi:30605_t:CDS:1 [Gigaspora margarita]|uniref:30605_t:CDS:1 n=1 Tax=Gigaspora margarita TaxID=4874 RepID=A0ABN7VE84_GIGMA|nr:30605_t:CDS:1 [Gigaspora margarita]
MNIEKENKYHDVSLNFSSNEYDKSDDNDPTISEQDELQNATSLSSVPTKKHDSLVWQYFNVDNPEPVCKVCKNDFSSTSSTSTLRRHLKIHNIIVPKQK